MEILKHGQTYKKASCPKCDCVVAYTNVDLKYDVFRLKKMVHISLRCPECGSYIIFQEKELDK